MASKIDLRRRAAGWANRSVQVLSRSRRLARAAALLTNQCGLLIGYHFTRSCDAEQNGERWLLDLVGPMIYHFIDVGANVGNWTLMLLARSPTAQGVAVEPGVEANVCLHDRLPQHVEILPAAAGKAGGGSVMPFYEQPGAGVRSSVLRGWVKDPIQREVQMITIDSLIDRLEWTEVDFLKIDTEGYDSEVLFGTTTALHAQRIGIVQFEYNRPWRDVGSTLSCVTSLFSGAGYDLYILRPTGLEPYDYSQFGEFFSYANFVAVSPISPLRRILGIS